MSESNVELVRRGWEAASRGDIEAVRELLAPQVKWYGGDPNGPGVCHNREQALEYMRGACSRRPLGDLVEVIDAGEKVVLITRLSAMEGEEGQLRANVTTFRDGRAVEMVHYPNADDARAAAGI